MATFTANYNLRKPAGGDLVTVAADINASMDTLDTQIKTRADDIAGHETRLDVLETMAFAKIRKTANQSIADNTTAALLFQEDSYTLPGGFANQANERLVIPTTGWYEVEAQVIFDAGAVGRRAVNLLLNGVGVRSIRIVYSTAANNAICQARWILNLTAGNFLTLEAYHNQGAALNVIGGAANTTDETYLAARRVYIP